jgi:hypothetical protein
MDVAGRLVWATKGIFPKGLNEIPFQKDSFLSDGVYFYKLETSAFSDVKRMILTTNQ